MKPLHIINNDNKEVEMAKRFTDTDKWSHAWFRRLRLKFKCAWIYLLDNCNQAGIWVADLEALSFYIGEEITKEEIEEVFCEKISIIEHDKYLINSFIEFQYGELRANNNVHNSVIRQLEKYGIAHDAKFGLSSKPSAILHRLSDKRKREILASDFYKCSYCGLSGDNNTLVIDHIVPRSIVGENEKENLTTACISCNSKKTDMNVFRFIAQNNLSQKLSENLKNKLALNNKLSTPNKDLLAPNNSLLGAMDKDKDKDKDKDIINGTLYAENNTLGNNNWSEKINQDSIIAMFNSTCAGKGKIKPFRSYFFSQNMIDEFFKITGDPLFRKVETWQEAFDTVAQSQFLTQEFNTTLNWVLNHDNLQKILSGQYQTRVESQKSFKNDPASSGNESDKLFDRILSAGRNGLGELKKELTVLEFRVIQEFGSMLEIYNATSTDIPRIKKKFRDCYMETMKQGIANEQKN